SVAERQAFFRRMRELARKVAESYSEQRKGLEYPLLKSTEKLVPSKKISLPSPSIAKPSTFVLEIGTEELPASDLDTAISQLSDLIPKLLKDNRLPHDEIKVFGTPRRLVVSVQNLAERQEDYETEIKGPPASRAYDADGMPTGTAQGFWRSTGTSQESSSIKSVGSGEYLVALKSEIGKPVIEVLKTVLPNLVGSIKFEKTMKWNDSGVLFSRPIRWLLALIGDNAIPFEYAGVASGNTSRGLRPYDSPEIKIPSADKYFDVIREAGITLDKEERKASIVEQVKQAASIMGGEAIIEEGLLNEVTNLIEMPTAVMGGFDPEFLQLPKDVLISVMKKHQRYFPVAKANQPITNYQLLPHFIAIRNGDDLHIDIVREGNEHVLGARFADA
ncbi:glycine--tRNA ligase subunit beta, partial [bacterium]|nr:glycine--tRNA ligase subunit beta [bacterium]